ncbi:MAG: hypothetical protein A3J83_02430 [Elusimicrobia bacterium RIFOXYA2_FULL_40_6]|nr:MAG: hypothetical protein A3J83_02430 [Elusimicrobia bacterium RIFOXYA2_FULL_40_6]
MENKKKILIVDDNKGVYDLFCRMLGDKYAVGYAENGQKAFDILKYDLYDIIFLDLIMPKMYGIEFLKKANEDKLKLPPVVVITGYITDELKNEALRLGAVSCVDKPFSEQEIQDFVHNLPELN